MSCYSQVGVLTLTFQRFDRFERRFHSDKAGYSGEAYDRNVFEANLSTVNKIQRDFWNAKQLLRKKMGKQDDDCIVASDSEIDSKLVVRVTTICIYEEIYGKLLNYFIEIIFLI